MTNSTERRTPAEWEPQRCIVAATPTRARTWPMCLQQAQAQHAAMLDAIRHVTPVHPLDQLGITPGDAWLRDTGPVFTLENKQLRAVDFRTDHYGHSYPDIEPDDMVGEQLSAALQTALRSPGVLRRRRRDRNQWPRHRTRDRALPA